MTLGLKSRDDMARLLSVSPNPAQIVVLRQRKNDATVSTLQEELDVYREKAGEAERIRDSFRSDNVRLTHRISYLEEQVAELLSRTPKGGESTARNSPHDEKSDDSRVQVFQKGSKVTVINNPSPRKNILKTRDSLPIVAQNKTRTSNASKSMDLLSAKENFSGPGDLSVSTLRDSRRGDSMTRLNTRRLGDIVHCSSPTTNGSKNVENYYNLLQERYIRENRNNNLLSNGTSERTHRQQHFKEDRSCKSADFDSEPNYQSFNRNNHSKVYYDSETSSDYSKTIKYGRPIPPQKPLRLSLHKGCSLQSVKIIDKSNSDIELCKKYARRSQKIDGVASDDNLGGNRPKEKWC